MRTILSFVLIFAFAVSAFADPLVMTVTDRDDDGKKFENNLRKLVIQIEPNADRERRLVEFLKTQELLERNPWLQWQQAERKDGVATYVVHLTVNPGFVKFRMTSDGDTRKTFVVDGLASFAGMRALSGEMFELKTLGDEIVYERKTRR